VYPFRPLLFVSIALLAVGFAGCGESLNLQPASGTVTYNGKPVEGANVAFTPPKGPPGTGRTDKDGKYTIMTNGKPGATAGLNTVTITKTSSTSNSDMTKMKPEDMQKMASSGQMPKYKAEIPTKYSVSQGGLTAEVSAGKAVHDFDLKD